MTSAIRAQRENEDGFTLIELLVVVIIIGILAAIAIPAFLNQRERAWESELTSTVRNVALDLESAATANGGDYTIIDDTVILDALEDFQGAGTGDAAVAAEVGPVKYAAGDFAVSTVAFGFCMNSVPLVDAGATNTAQTYISSAGGLQGLAAACAVPVLP